MRHDPRAALLTIPLDRSSDRPLYVQIYTGVRDAVLSKRLLPGDRLLSTRDFAAELDCSRSTVVAAYEQLWAEGYIDGSLGSGTYVSRNIPEELLSVPRRDGAAQRDDTPYLPVSRRGQRLSGLRSARRLPYGAFTPCVPDAREFPFGTWTALFKETWNRPARDLLEAADPYGHLPLREQIARYLGTVRAVRCSAEQVIITSGAQQAFNIVATMLLDPGDEVWVEDPGYYGVHSAFIGAGAKVVYLPVDEEGLSVKAGRQLGGEPRMVVVAPSHQYPLGVVMSLGRRLELLSWARESRSWIVEDDYDSEFRYGGHPFAALQGMDDRGCVIYIGTFSKVLFPSMRIGYLVLPRSLLEPIARARLVIESYPSIMLQPVLARFMAEGHFATHVRRMRKIYEKRKAALLDAARRHLPRYFEVADSDCGMHLLMRFTPEAAARLDDQALSARCREHGLFVPAISEYHSRRAGPRGLVVGYTAVDPDEIEDGIARLAAIAATMAGGARRAARS
ncbi:MAG: PLP-dependent aminotransferase family protein [Alphaproteobacteria bacterium]